MRSAPISQVEIEEELLRLLLMKSVTIEEAVQALKTFDAAVVIELIRRKLDVQELVMDDFFRLMLPA